MPHSVAPILANIHRAVFSVSVDEVWGVRAYSLSKAYQGIDLLCNIRMEWPRTREVFVVIDSLVVSVTRKFECMKVQSEAAKVNNRLRHTRLWARNRL